MLIRAENKPVSLSCLTIPLVVALMLYGSSAAAVNTLNMSGEIPCNTQFTTLTIPITRTKTGSQFSIHMQLKDMNTQPAVMAFFNDKTEFATFNTQFLSLNLNIDFLSFTQKLNTQELKYESKPNQLNFFINVYRTKTSNLFSNSIRCTLATKFNITVQEFDAILPNPETLLTNIIPQCLNGGVYNNQTKTCICKPNYGSIIGLGQFNCNIFFIAIPKLSEKTTNTLEHENLKAYYYDNLSNRNQTLAINLKGNKSGDYKFVNSSNPQFGITIFHQERSKNLSIQFLYFERDPQFSEFLHVPPGHRFIVIIFSPNETYKQEFSLELVQVASANLQTETTQTYTYEGVPPQMSLFRTMLWPFTMCIIIFFLTFLCVLCMFKRNSIYFQQKYPPAKYDDLMKAEWSFPSLPEHQKNICVGCKIQNKAQVSAEVRITYCGHIFHSKCLEEGFESISSVICPKCNVMNHREYISKIEQEANIVNATEQPISRLIKIWNNANKSGESHYMTLKTEPDTQRNEIVESQPNQQPFQIGEP